MRECWPKNITVGWFALSGIIWHVFGSLINAYVLKFFSSKGEWKKVLPLFALLPCSVLGLLLKLNYYFLKLFFLSPLRSAPNKLSFSLLEFIMYMSQFVFILPFGHSRVAKEGRSRLLNWLRFWLSLKNCVNGKITVFCINCELHKLVNEFSSIAKFIQFSMHSSYSPRLNITQQFF